MPGRQTYTTDPTIPIRRLVGVSGAVVLAYVAALGTILSATPALAPAVRLTDQLVGAGIPFALGLSVARRFDVRQVLARAGGFALLSGAAAVFAAWTLADLLLTDRTDTGPFVVGSALFIAVLVFIAALAGACIAWTQQRLGRTSTSQGSRP